MEEMYSSSPQPTMSTGKSSNSGMVWMIVLGVLLLAAVGFAVWEMFELNNKTSEISSLKNSNTQLQAQVKSLEEQVGVAETSGTSEADTNKILAATDAYTRAPVAVATDVFTYEVAENNGEFAKVTVKVEGKEGFELVLKKVDNAWTVVVSTQDSPTQADLDEYAIPAGFVTL